MTASRVRVRSVGRLVRTWHAHGSSAEPLNSNGSRRIEVRAYAVSVQIVGRECSTCRERLKSEVGAIGCERCDLAFHDACLKAGPPTTYRDATAKKPKSAPLLCPTCGDDLRALQRERDAERDALHTAAEHRRAVDESRRARNARMTNGVLMMLLGLALLALRVWLRTR